MSGMSFRVYTDGGSINNPGRAASAYIIYNDSGVLFKHARAIGVATNNIAEYSALIFALEKIRDVVKQPRQEKPTSITVFSDSRLLVFQINGLFRVKNAAIRDCILKVRVLEGEVGIPILYKNIPREKNAAADRLVKEKLFSYS